MSDLLKNTTENTGWLYGEQKVNLSLLQTNSEALNKTLQKVLDNVWIWKAFYQLHTSVAKETKYKAQYLVN